jgi:hypothetical protein
MTPRAFREAVVRQHVPHVRLGARVVVLVADLERLAHASVPAPSSGKLPVNTQDPATIDDALAELGFTRRRA